MEKLELISNLVGGLPKKYIFALVNVKNISQDLQTMGYLLHLRGGWDVDSDLVIEQRK